MSSTPARWFMRRWSWASPIPETGKFRLPVALLGKRQSDSEQQLRDHVAEHLAAYKNPTHYLFLDQIPRTGTGKFDRNQLHQAAQREFGS